MRAASIARGVRRVLERDRDRLTRTGDRLAPLRASVSNATASGSSAHTNACAAPPRSRVERKRAALENSAAKLATLSPLQTLRRGYAIVRTDSRLVTSSSDVEPGDRVDVTLADGAFGARVEEVTP